MKRRSLLLKLAGERARSERAVTITELMITMMILGVVLGITLNFINSSAAVLGNVEDTTEGLRDVNILTDRLSRDIRDARGIDETTPNGSGESRLVIWIDYNSDYAQSLDETISWNLEEKVSDPGQFNAVRRTGTGVTEILGTTLVSVVVFSYSPVISAIPADPNPHTVAIGITYDAIQDAHASQKTVTFSTRLRNAQ